MGGSRSCALSLRYPDSESSVPSIAAYRPHRAAGGGGRMSGLVADRVNGRRGEAFKARVVDERCGQHEAALRPAHPEGPPPDEWLLRWKVQLPLLHGREHARSIERT